MFIRQSKNDLLALIYKLMCLAHGQVIKHDCWYYFAKVVALIALESG